MNTAPPSAVTGASAAAAAPAPDDGSADDASTDTRRPIRLGFGVLVLGFGSALLWAGLAPLDEGVPATATISIETRRNTIQHFNGGVVRQVFVKDGQHVKAGDDLLLLGDSQAQANLASVRQNYFGLRASESRLLAEQAGVGMIDFHSDLRAASGEPTVKQHMAVQLELFNARRSALRSELQAGEEGIASLQAQIAGFVDMARNRQSQSRLMADQLGNLRTLAEQGYAPRSQLLQLEQAQAELQSVMAELEANTRRARKGIDEARQHLAQRQQEYLKEVATQLADIRREVQAGQEKLHALREELARVRIQSPVDGQVVGLAITAVGGVVSPSQRLMDIVPQGQPLLLDARIPPHIIDKVRLGAMADVRFTGFSHAPDLVVGAEVVSLAGDAVTESTPAGTVSYYLARLQITPDGKRLLGSHVLQPGMQAEVLVKTGERSMLTYLMHPLTKRLASAMKEE